MVDTFPFRDRELAKRAGKIGGKATGLKGLAWLKVNDPAAFRQFYIDREKKRKEKALQK